MELRYLLGIVGIVGYLAFANRTALVSFAKSAATKLAPLSKNTKVGWLIPLAIGGVVFWPEISAWIPRPQPVVPIVEPDMVDRAFEAQETAFRKLQSDKATRLRAGEFASESESVKWFESQYIDAKKKALNELLEFEYESFGMEKWSPESEAAIAEKLAVQGGVK